MKLLRQSYRSWWQAPRRYSEQEEDRRITFLELFYDLVYVVIISELSHFLSQHITAQGIGSFIFLFLIVWWAWLNGALYHDYHGNNHVRTRVFTFLQMISVGAILSVLSHLHTALFHLHLGSGPGPVLPLGDRSGYFLVAAAYHFQAEQEKPQSEGSASAGFGGEPLGR